MFFGSFHIMISLMCLSVYVWSLCKIMYALYHVHVSQFNQNRANTVDASNTHHSASSLFLSSGIVTQIGALIRLNGYKAILIFKNAYNLLSTVFSLKTHNLQRNFSGKWNADSSVNDDGKSHSHAYT